MGQRPVRASAAAPDAEGDCAQHCRGLAPLAATARRCPAPSLGICGPRLL